jgi:hypothetical protein
MPKHAVAFEAWLSAAEVALGIVLALSPVTFWVAWTPSLLLGAMAVAVVSGALLGLLHDWRASREPSGFPRSAASLQPVLPDGFVDEIHRIYPLTYHHSNIGRGRFRRAMENLRMLSNSAAPRE